MAAIAVIIPVAFGGAAASATELPPGDPTSLEATAPTPEQETLPASGDTTAQQPVVVQESAPAPVAQPVVAAPVQPEAATVVAPAPSVPVPAEDTQPAPPQAQVVTVEDETATPEARTTGHPPVEKCVTLNKKTMSHTFNETTGTTGINVSGKVGTPVCNPAFVVIAPFAYLVAGSMWPQEDVGRDNQTRIYVDKVGSYSATPLFIKNCRQYDAYISFKSWEDATPPKVLITGGNPYEPDFVHQYSTGPTTYHASSAHGCAGKPEVPGPKVTTSEWTETAFVCGDTVVNSSRTVTTTYFKVVFVDGKFKLVEDTAKSTVVTEHDSRPLKDTEIESCKPAIPEPKVVKSDTTEEAFKCLDTSVATKYTETTTPFKAVLVSGSTWELVEDTANATTVTVNGTRPLTPEEVESCKPVVPEPTVVTGEWEAGAPDCVNEKVIVTRTVSTTTSTPVFVSGSTWTVFKETTIATETREESLSDAQLEACKPVVVPPTVNHPAPPQPVAHAAAPAPKPPVLASTGAEIGGTLSLAALLLALGTAFVVSKFIRRRREATNE